LPFSVVDGRGIVMTTTNGTLAIERCLAAEMVLVGSFLNRNAVARRLFFWRRIEVSMQFISYVLGRMVTKQKKIFLVQDRSFMQEFQNQTEPSARFRKREGVSRIFSGSEWFE